jgi:hypothetical protein
MNFQSRSVQRQEQFIVLNRHHEENVHTVPSFEMAPCNRAIIAFGIEPAKGCFCYRFQAG